MAGVHWVVPQIVAEVYYRGIGNLGLLRQPSLKVVRADKTDADLRKERSGQMRRKEAKLPATKRKPEARITPVARAKPARRPASAPVRLTHPERRVYPEGYTKGDVAQYYIEAMPWILPGLRGRPLSVIRCPEGIGGECFFQKHVRAGLKLVQTVPIREESGKVDDYVYVDSAEALLELVQFNALEFHPWPTQASDPEHADYVVFDLDPAPGVTWPRVVAAAELVRERCRPAHLESFVRTTGGKGLHVVVPLRPAVAWAQAKDFARNIAEAIAAEHPDEFVAQAAKNKRDGRIFIDWLRNARGATSIASYSLRARAGAAVATPLRWEELRRTNGPADFDIRSVPARLRRLRSDPWKGFDTLLQGLGAKAPASASPRRARR
jgi:bifunctional non-homologous end joining protein LigD